MATVGPAESGIDEANVSGDPIFRLTDVSYSYREGEEAVCGATLAVSAGETVAILGANGCGKSTLLRLMAGILFAKSGSVEAWGKPLTEAGMRDAASARLFRRRVGYLFQNAEAQLFCPTVRDDILFGPRQMGLADDELEHRLGEITALFGLKRLLERAPYELSTGEQRKAALAGVLIMTPDVLLLDEPSAGLDPRTQRWLVDLLTALSAAGYTIVTATHDLNILPEIADRLIVFDEQHRIAAQGALPDILPDLQLLTRVNLIDPGAHRHGRVLHSHEHTPSAHSHEAET